MGADFSSVIRRRSSALGSTHGLHVVLERLTKLGEIGHRLMVLGFVIHPEISPKRPE